MVVTRVIVAALDPAAGNAVHSTLPAGVGYTTVDLSTNFLRPVNVDSGTLRSTGSIINQAVGWRWRRADWSTGDERPLAHATSTCLILEP